MEVSLGISPCPNDTFIFAAIINGWIDTKGIKFNPIIKDVEELNQLAFMNSADITKLSFYTYCKLASSYILLNSGSALGIGVGPLLVTNQDSLMHIKENLPTNTKVGLPGKETTAHFLFNFFQKADVVKEFIVFNKIEESVIERKVDCGVIIHENRFTYQERGLMKIVDLGNYWEKTTSLPIPLGGIVSKSEYGQEFADLISLLIKDSLSFAYRTPEKVLPFVKFFSQDLSNDVIQKHIDLYVNEFTFDLGGNGRKAVNFMKSLVLQEL